MITIKKPNFVYSTFTITKFDEIYSRLARFGVPSWGGGSDSRYSNVRVPVNRLTGSEYIYVYHAEKHRKKVERTVVNGKKVSKIVEHGHWKVRVFRFRKGNIVSAEQFRKHFKVTISVS